MNTERAEKSEKPPSIDAALNTLELRVHKLTGEVRGNMDAVKVSELSQVAEGQSALLKVLQASDRFKDRALSIAAGSGVMSVGFDIAAKLFSNPDDAEAFMNIAETGYRATTAAALFGMFFVMAKGGKWDEQIRATLSLIKGRV